VLCLSLVKDGYKIACCSKSIRKTVLTVLAKLGIIEYFDLIISNEDVKIQNHTLKCIGKQCLMMSCLPEETLIVEDSPYGLLQQARSKSIFYELKNPKEVTYNNIFKKLNK
jgi:beta-phosphoglucomutase